MDEEKEKRKSLGGVRPSPYIYNKFMELAKERQKTQSDLFDSIFWEYLGVNKKDKQEQAISFEAELNLINNDLKNIFNHFKTIATKSQNTVISLKSNTEQTVKNFSLDLETSNNTLLELKKRNDELENSNSVFVEVKTALENKISELTKKEIENSALLKDLHKAVTEKDKKIKELEELLTKTEEINNKQIKNLNTSVDVLQEETQSKSSKINSLEVTISSLKDTISSINLMKKSELEALESSYVLRIKNFEDKIRSFEENKNKEIENIKQNLISEYNADKKVAVADMQISLAEMKVKYAETLNRVSKLEQELLKINSQNPE